MKILLYILAVFAIAVLLLLWAKPWIGRAQIPELLGYDVSIVLLRLSENRVVGLVWNDYAMFLLRGTGDRNVVCTLSHLAGGEVGGAEQEIPCLFVWSSENKFRGWIDFRGHPRAFCGAASGFDFPSLCKLR